MIRFIFCIRRFKKVIQFAFIAAVFSSFFISCNQTKYVPENQYLLKKSKLINKDKAVSKETLKTYIKQQPNKSIFGVKFFLGLYDLSNTSKKGWLNNWLRKIGEEPVIWNPLLTQKSSRQLNQYLNNCGYFHSVVTDSVVFNRKKAVVFYKIQLNKPFTINSIRYLIEDERVANIVFADTMNSLLHSGNIFNIDQLLQERERIERVLKEKGYYNFSKEYIYYDADTSSELNIVDLTLGIKKFLLQKGNGYFFEYPHRTYYIHSVSLFPDYTSKLLPNDSIASGMQKYDCNSIKVFYVKKLVLKPNLLCQSSYLVPGNLYNIDDVDRTYKNLAALRNFKSINISFQEVDTLGNDSIGRYPLNCYISMTPSKKQSYNWELVATNSGGNIGFGVNLIYQHKNIFRGAESFNLKLNGSLEFLKESEAIKYHTLYEYGAEAKIVFPKFLLPLSNGKFIRDYNPKTSVTIAYSYQQRPDYTRKITNIKFGYSWKTKLSVSHILNPVEVSTVDTANMDPGFLEDISSNPYQLNSFSPHFIWDASYSYIFNNQTNFFDKDYLFYRLNLEASGNLIYLISNWTNQPTDSSGYYKIFGKTFSQYIKADLDMRYSMSVEQSNNIVLRLFIGIGYPWYNSRALPFEKSYSVGGSNSMRAWEARSLGPGSYKADTKSKYPFQTGDIRIEGNIEYRFKLFWKMEGAAFLDIGNIWTLRQSYNEEGTQFKFDQFLNDLAVGSGLGTRFNFDFFILRFDVGLKLRDPSDNDPGVPDGKQWIIGNRSFSGRDLGYNIAIGYPF